MPPLALPTKASVAAWFRAEPATACIEDSFLPGYNEMVFVSINSIDRPLRVVRKIDPRTRNLQLLSSVVLGEVKRAWMTREVANGLDIIRLNAKSGQQDGAWWDPWLRHQRRARAVREASAVMRYGGLSRISLTLKTHLADLINRELVDVELLEALTRPVVQNGNRLSVKDALKDIRTKRRARGDEALLHTAITQILQENPAVARSTAELPVSAAQENEMTILPVNAEASLREAAATALPESTTGSPKSVVTGNAGTPAAATMALPESTGTFPEAVALDYAANLPVSDEPGPPNQASVPDGDVDISVLRVPERSLVSVNAKEIQAPQISLAHPDTSNTDQQSPQATEATGDMSPAKSASMVELSSLASSQQSQHSSSPAESLVEGTDRLVSDTVSEASDTATIVPGTEQRASTTKTTNTTGQWTAIKWAYKTNTPVDAELTSKGVWLYDRPTSLAQWGHAAAPNLPPGIPIIVSPDNSGGPTPSLSTDGSTIVLQSHNSPFRGDTRSIQYFAGLHPDFQTTARLPEYQAVELLGRTIWRHDRDILFCSETTCQKPLTDLSPFTLICHGCGPKSIVRWCSYDCKRRNLGLHGQSCGDPQLLIQGIIDDATTPPRFSYMPPAIRDKHGLHTAQSYRQKVYAQLHSGRYTLFDPQSQVPTKLIWMPQMSALLPDKEVPCAGYANEMESRIERCLNIALFDHRQTMVIEYLFRLLQHCLHLKNSYRPALYYILAGQFRWEFAFDADTSFRINRKYHGICECEWAGMTIRQEQHDQGCSRGGKMRDVGVGEMFRASMGVKDLVEKLEKNHWVLRAWRYQHPT
ncbi:MAG: hypothetical protein Q9218_007506, partial [Villophora microphyllina]